MRPARTELRDFLRGRRERLTPGDVGLPDGGRRRTPGLRREEVALLAGVGVSWYTWLEQGRDITVSGAVVDAIATTLRLSPTERTHLHVLAGLNPPVAPDRLTPGTVTPELRRVVDAWSPRPAVLRDCGWNLLALNDAARTVFGFTDDDRNCLVAFFLNARYRGMHDDGETVAAEVVATFRADAALAPDDPGIRALVADLTARSDEFAALWARHDVGPPVQRMKTLRHPVAGDLTFDLTTLAVADHRSTYLELSLPRPGTPTEQRLASLVVPVPG